MDLFLSYTVAYLVLGFAIIYFAALARCWLLLAGKAADFVVNAEILIRKLARLSRLSLDSPPEWLTTANRVLLWVSLILVSAGIIQLLLRYRYLMSGVVSNYVKPDEQSA